ncbi:MAG: amino acid permease [Bacteroidota bacterium]
MATNDSLRRELGFWDALTIGAGTMIGAGIFLLSGVALSLTGPAAIFSYIGAGLVCMVTAASAAELATGMPTSGGDYYFVSRSIGPALGAISGVGIWLSLTFAIAFYLYGLGEYLSQLLPVTPFLGALAGGVLLTALNVIGAKESGRMQVVVVLTLFVILGGFAVVGAFNIEAENFRPFFPFGVEPIFSTTALVFVSFLGFVKIAAVAEEIENPSRNLPRALIGSVALVTVLYVVILLVIAGIFPQRVIGEVRDPLTTAARNLFGTPGGLIIIFAGLLATLSSANASIMASSRINLAMARDRMVPNWLSAIHERLLTPHRAILVTGILALLFLLIESLETLAKIASVLQLYSYAAINIGAVVLRASSPDWYRPSFRAPGYPVLHILAAVACLAIVVFSGPLGQLALVGLILFSLAWYFVWGSSRVKIDTAVPHLRAKWSDLGIRMFLAPAVRYAKVEPEAGPRPPRTIDVRRGRRVMAALANPKTEAALLTMGCYIATGTDEGGRVRGVHMIRVPIQTPLEVARDKVVDETAFASRIAVLRQRQVRWGGNLSETEIEGRTDVAHNPIGALIDDVTRRGSDILLMGWQGEFSVTQIYRSPVQRIVSEVEADVAVLKNRGLDRLNQILLPWGGGMHARLGLEIALRVAHATGAEIELLRIVREGVDHELEQEKLMRSVSTIVGDFDRIRAHVVESSSVTDGLDRRLSEQAFDLVIIGASHEWRIRNVLFGAIPDIVADSAPCSVLMVRRYLPEHWSGRASESLKRMKEYAGFTSSPEEPT